MPTIKKQLYMDFEEQWVTPILLLDPNHIFNVLDDMEVHHHISRIFSLGDEYWKFLRTRAVRQARIAGKWYYQHCVQAYDILDDERRAWTRNCSQHLIARAGTIDLLVNAIATEILIANKTGGGVKRLRKYSNLISQGEKTDFRIDSRLQLVLERIEQSWWTT